MISTFDPRAGSLLIGLWRRRRLTLATWIGLTLVGGGSAAEPLALLEVARGVFVHRGEHQEMSAANFGGVANVGFIVGGKGVAVIDSGGSLAQGERLREALRAITDLPVRYVINTHMHPDHVLGNAAFLADGAVFVGHARLRSALQRRAQTYLTALRRNLGPAADGTEIVLPGLEVEAVRELDLGDRVLRLTAHATAHTDNDLSVYDVATGTLWLADLLFVERIPVVDGSLNGWLRVLNELSAIKAEHAIPGHGPAAVPWPEAVADQKRYLGLLRDEIRAVLKRGGRIEEAIASVGQAERARWALFEENNARNVAASFVELEWE